MRRLIRYFREKPIRLFYTAILLSLVLIPAIRLPGFLFKTELFAKIVADPDHRMVRGDTHFNGLNSDNIRSHHEAADIKDSDFNIIFLGDSYIYGFLLNPTQAPPTQLEMILRKKYHRSDINVINFGWTSSSPILSQRLLNDLGKKYKPDLILLSIDMSDYRDEWFYKSVLQQRGFYFYVTRHPRLSYLLKALLELLEPYLDWHSRLFGYSGSGGYFVARQPMETSINLFDDLYATLLQINADTRDTFRVPFVVFAPPRHWQYTDKESPDSWENGSFDALGPYALENYRYFSSKQGEMPFPFYTLLDEFKQTKEYPLSFKVDSHWNKHGARFFAERVSEKISPILDNELNAKP